MKNHHSCVTALLLVAMVMAPVAGAANSTTDPAYYLTHADTLAGQKDMSQYNPVITPVPLHTMNETTARLYPNVITCGKDRCLPESSCPFPFVPCENLLTLQVVYNANASHPDHPGPVIGYSLSGWPLQSPLYIIPAGKADLSPQFVPFKWRRV